MSDTESSLLKLKVPELKARCKLVRTQCEEERDAVLTLHRS